MIKHKILYIFLFTSLLFADFSVSNRDEIMEDLGGEYTYGILMVDDCHCNVVNGADLINGANIIPFEKTINKQISQSIIDTKNLSLLVVSDWLRALGAESYAGKVESDFVATMINASKSSMQEQKTQKICSTLDLQILSLNSAIINAEMKLIRLKQMK